MSEAHDPYAGAADINHDADKHATRDMANMTQIASGKRKRIVVRTVAELADKACDDALQSPQKKRFWSPDGGRQHVARSTFPTTRSDQNILQNGGTIVDSDKQGSLIVRTSNLGNGTLLKYFWDVYSAILTGFAIARMVGEKVSSDEVERLSKEDHDTLRSDDGILLNNNFRDDITQSRSPTIDDTIRKFPIRVGEAIALTLRKHSEVHDTERRYFVMQVRDAMNSGTMIKNLGDGLCKMGIYTMKIKSQMSLYTTLNHPQIAFTICVVPFEYISRMTQSPNLYSISLCVYVSQDTAETRFRRLYRQ